METKGKFMWSREMTLHLIDLYERMPILYNIKLGDYKNKTKRNAALGEIRDSLCSKYKLASDQCLTMEDIKNKIHILRTQYFRELRASKVSKVSGVGTEEVYVPKLWCFQQLNFLIEADVVSNSFSNLENKVVENEEGSSQDTLVFDGSIEDLALAEFQNETTSPVSGGSVNITPRRRSDKKIRGDISHLIENATIALNAHRASKHANEDDVHSFALSLSHEMSKIKKPKNVRLLKRKIFNLILDVQEEEAEEETDKS